MRQPTRQKWLGPEVRRLLDLAAETLDRGAYEPSGRDRLLLAADGLLRAACQASDLRHTLWSTAREGHQTYELRRRVMRAFRARFPRHADVALFPEAVLTLPGGLPPPSDGELPSLCEAAALEGGPPEAETFYRIAAGWPDDEAADAGLFLPHDRFGPRLVAAFRDSPYGPPVLRTS